MSKTKVTITIHTDIKLAFPVIIELISMLNEGKKILIEQKQELPDYLQEYETQLIELREKFKQPYIQEVGIKNYNQFMNYMK